MDSQRARFCFFVHDGALLVSLQPRLSIKLPQLSHSVLVLPGPHHRLLVSFPADRLQ